MRTGNWGLTVAAWCIAGGTHAADLHRLWDDACAPCHDHAGEFAREELTVVDGILEGRRPGRDLRGFLARHADVTAADADRLYGMLVAQAGQPDLFRRRCSICHVSAAELGRDLALRDGALYGRYTGRPIAAFLEGHGRVAAEEIPVFLDVLRRVQAEVSQP